MSVHHHQQQQLQQQQHAELQQLQQQQQIHQHLAANGEGSVLAIDGTTGVATAVVIEAGHGHQPMDESTSVVVNTAGGNTTVSSIIDASRTVGEETNFAEVVTTSNITAVELQNMQAAEAMTGVASFPLRMWTNDLTYKLLEKVQDRKSMLLDPKLRRRMVYAAVAAEFQKEGVAFTTSDIEKKYTSLLSTYRRNMDRRKGSTWQYYNILEDIYSEVGPDGTKVHLPTSNINPHQPPPASVAASPVQVKQELRQSKRMRTRPARLKGHVDYTSAGTTSSRYDTDFYAAESFDRVRELMNERLDELQSQRDSAFLDSKKAWSEVKDGLDSMSDNIQTLNGSVLMLAHTVSSVLNALNKSKK